jgi:cellulose synthase/poly-beta-1,6-N-acetylglucosamine synthase-like glycosyltransferase
MIIIQIIFWICLFLVFYTYLLFPFILRLLAGKRGISASSYSIDDLPVISVLIAAHNEEKVIGNKISSVLNCNYPLEKLELLVGSDASTDETNDILNQLAEAHPSLRLLLYKERVGKPQIINRLANLAKGEILVITDANVMLQSNTLFELVRYFREEHIGLVDSMLISTGIKEGGISVQEKFYTSREVTIKQHESLLWGSMMGPFGGCYAVRKSLYRSVPDHFLVDDFYINMSVLEQDAWCINNMQAKVYEDVSNNSREEFKRKKRISAGNYQNLKRFLPMLFKGRKGVGFCFLSHKVIRWKVPFLVIFTLASSAILGMNYLLYMLLLLLQLLVLFTPVIDHFLRKIGIQSLPLRFISHFVLMNLAMLAGFLRYLGGIKNNVWQPTSRIQD